MEIDKSGPITVLIQVYYFIACDIRSGWEFRVVMWLRWNIEFLSSAHKAYRNELFLDGRHHF